MEHMMISTKESIFLADVLMNNILILGIVWSIAFPKKRIWPPPKKLSWQYPTTWILFHVPFILNVLLMVLDWNSWVIPHEIRFHIGIPFLVIGVLLATWGFTTLGEKNNHGLKNGFVPIGPYRYTRNPQYLGMIIAFTGISLISNSLYVATVHLLMILVYLFAPFTEEVWLEEQYGDEYKKYKTSTARFL
ncbi:methyltransferase family protein [Planctomycetota bacterium]